MPIREDTDTLTELFDEQAPETPETKVVTEKPRTLSTVRGWQDILFRATARTGGFTVMMIMLLVGVFLLFQGYTAIQSAGINFFTTEAWEPNEGNFGIAAVLFGTVTIALIAIVVAVPLALGTALYISEYAPRQIKQTLISVVDLMAAVPSVVYGLWGMFWLEPAILPFAQWIATYFGWIPFLQVTDFEPGNPLSTPTVFTASAFIAGLVVALMVAPIASSIMREVFSQAPLGEREGALALGSTRWGMITSVVLPFGRGGIIGGTMLGLGRALGETIAVFLVISPVFIIQPHILQTGTNSISSLIALRYSESSPFELSALMAAGLALFLITLVVNFGASIIISRSRSGASSEG
ncbi:phosphate ABC transporter permease subunit PstC [Compostimonas suwonensis]|uniref:Phosphate transport system permease protein n=1 Tax=Compostimonas suwonensis TaxID=1048394 RepID=A0A2M9C050_9MICO|nr:phosphate ABC transporter permease subunit PstC [Compostimonas suwonensis]PJJ63717.1 phosphate transport system permease protein [Compostimonas suwonensis]